MSLDREYVDVLKLSNESVLDVFVMCNCSFAEELSPIVEMSLEVEGWACSNNWKGRQNTYFCGIVSSLSEEKIKFFPLISSSGKYILVVIMLDLSLREYVLRLRFSRRLVSGN